MITATLMIFLAYFIGSLSSAIIVARCMQLPDPRSQGSGNPGATNVLRLGGKIPAIITLTGDVLKGVVPVLLARCLGVEGFLLGLVALSAVIGHVYPFFFKFKGGKGVATAVGAVMALSVITSLSLLIIWVAVVFITRYVSLSSLIAAIAAPIMVLIFSQASYVIPILAIAAIIIWRHFPNIRRLQNGSENKIQF